MNQASKKSDSGSNDGARARVYVLSHLAARRFFEQTAGGRSGADGGRPQLIN